MCRLAKALVCLSSLLAFTMSSQGQTKGKDASDMTPLEKRASLNLEAARSNPLQLRNLLLKMPKGADLHNHLYGAVYAETWIRNAKAGYEIGWQDDLAHFREALLAKGLGPDMNAAKEQLNEAEALRSKREHCGEPNESSACHVKIRYLCQVLRGFPKQQVFAQT